ncbi:uncharacterized protein LOC129775655 [Toxorhynchites rutilus septentrionalis]|uniref:uncharacterized protein LOC129775655 n=1 Tax=Toxorhynchites rutilus septentrionalis TaxID=329112 RepID=UPI00247A9EC0|nr:uncharacterized protein LOC129775655 [Toxorhynchites rutilus septentrionalis]
MQLLSEIPVIDTEAIDFFMERNATASDNDRNRSTRKTRSSAKKLISNVTVEELIVEKSENSPAWIVKGALREDSSVSTAKNKKKAAAEDKTTLNIHFLRLQINDTDCDDDIKSVDCQNCDKTKENCTKIYPYLLWLQQKQKEILQDIENMTLTAPKKIKRELNSDTALKPVNFEAELVKVELPSLTKLKKEVAQISPLELESAMRLSLFNLIREYQGNDPNDFLQFCGKRMREENCSTAQILTVEQADTDLWHELRKGRITASRIHEASRCTMTSGSLTSKIMGLSSGFSFAMKRGTELEGHVFAVLQEEYPSLKNTGLVLDPQFPWMGASPDGLADDFVLEIKCPYTPKTYECYVDVKKLSKKYFAQIQLQMHMTHKTKALLGVAALDFEKTRGVTKVWIDYDKDYVDNIMQEAFEFWQKGVFPALLKKRKSKK